MAYYRIKIDTLNDGTKRYYVQEGVLITTGGWFTQHCYIDWKTKFQVANEKDGLNMIETLKSQQIVSTEYNIVT